MSPARALALLLASSALLLACPRAPALPVAAPPAPKGSSAPARACAADLDDAACARARGMLAAAQSLSTVSHEYILDPTSSYAAGRGLQKSDAGLWSAVPTACAQPHAPKVDGHAVDATTIDFGFVGVAVDSTLVAADADLTPYFSAGGAAETHKLRLVAIAFVRDLDPQFFDAADDVAYAGDACTCGRATHFVGAVKLGGMLSYDLDVAAGDVHGRALDFVKAKLALASAEVTETRVGGLEVDGLDALVGDGAKPASARRLGFHVTNPVPIAYAVYPLADVCKFSLPAPQIAPEVVDFGEVPYGREGTRLLHVVNRASIDVTASFHGKQLEIPARGSADLETSWMPQGDAAGCEEQEREETVLVSPKDANVPVTPRQQTVRVVERVRSGKDGLVLRTHEDTGEHRAPDYRSTMFDSSCPPDYVVASCRTENAQCSDKAKTCTGDGYAVMATPTGNGCRFGCQGPTSLILPTNYCRFDAVTECRLRCAP